MAHQTTLPPHWRVRELSLDQPLQQRILRARGLVTQEDQQLFLKGDFYDHFYDGRDLPDMLIAITRLAAALEHGERVAIFGDYDADGIPATALLLRGLGAVGFTNLLYVIPTRSEGYGLQNDKIDALVADGCTVMITVDTGITAHEQVAYANSKGIDVIITDHHEVVHDIPQALAVIDPKRPDSTYTTRSLCGTAVAYKLLWSLYEELGVSHTYLKWQLDLVALATLADMVPLVGENRALAKTGLDVLHKTRNKGLRALLQVSGIDHTRVSARDVMFAIAPRINALSRLGEDTYEGRHPLVQLLVTDDDAEALTLAVTINDVNTRRQSLVATATTDALAQLDTDMQGGSVIYLPNAPSGITGLIAGRLADITGWPALVMAPEGDEIRGSGRSPTTLSMLTVLEPLAPLVTRYGGHAQAAGWSMAIDQLAAFSGQAREVLAQQSAAHPKGGEVVIDAVLQPHEATLDTAHALRALEPFGMGNEEPLLLWQDTVVQVTPMGQQKNHWRITTASHIDAVYFNVPSDCVPPQPGSALQAAVHFGINTYATPRPQLVVKHLHVSEKE